MFLNTWQRWLHFRGRIPGSLGARAPCPRKARKTTRLHFTVERLEDRTVFNTASTLAGGLLAAPLSGAAGAAQPGPLGPQPLALASRLVAPAVATAGQPFTFTVTVAAGYHGTVGFTSTDAAATLPEPYTFSAEDGCQHTFLATLTTVDSHGPTTLTAYDTANQTMLGSDSVTVSPAAPYSLEFVQQPVNGTAGEQLPPVTVRVEDRFGNLATDGTPAIKVALLDNPGGAALDGHTSRLASAGIATFDDLWITGAGSGYTLVATSPGLQATVPPVAMPTRGLSAAADGVDIFLKLATIKGESKDAMHKDEIEVQALSWGAARPGGQGQLQDVTFTAATSKASPALFQAALAGSKVGPATFSVRKHGATEAFLIWTLSTVTVDAAPGAAADQVTLRYQKVDLSYRPRKDDGTLGAPVTASWDLGQGNTSQGPFTASSTAQAGPGLDLFLKLDGIPGSSQDPAHKDQIPVESVTWDQERPGPRVLVRDLQLVVDTDQASPKLLQAVQSGQAIVATLSARRHGDNQDYLTWNLGSTFHGQAEGGVVVTAFGPGARLSQLTLAVQSFKETYLPKKEDGSWGDAVTASRDFGAYAGAPVAPVLGSTSAASDGVDIFLKLPSIAGESQDAKHPNEIEVQSLSWGASAPGGQGQLEDVTFTAATSKASPKLFQAALEGQEVGPATFTVRKHGFTDDFLTWTLTGVAVEAGPGATTDQVALRYHKVDMSYRPRQDDGTLGPPVTASWDLQRGHSQGPFTASSTAQAGPGLDLFLLLDGIPGSSKDSAHKDQIPVESVAWVREESPDGTFVRDLQLVVDTDQASPKLLEAVRTGQNIASAKLSARRHGDPPGDYLTWELGSVPGGAGAVHATAFGLGALQSQLTLDFQYIKDTYKPLRLDGSWGGAVTASWNFGAYAGTPAAPLLGATSAASDGVDIFLKLDKIKGESQDAVHKDEIEVQGLSWGAAGASAPGRPGQLQDVTFTAATSKASPALFQAALNGTDPGPATFSVRRHGATEDFLTLKLSTVNVDAAPGAAADQVTLRYQKVDVSYRPRKDDGTWGDAVTASWDLGKEHTSQGPFAADSTAAATSGLDLFLQLDGIQGSSQDSTHKDQIPVEAVAWVQERPTRGGAVIHDLRLTVDTDKASPELLQAVQTGQAISTAKLSIRRHGENKDYLTYDLSDVVVTGHGQGANHDQLSLAFQSITDSYWPKLRDGSWGGAVTATWDTHGRSRAVSNAFAITPAPVQIATTTTLAPSATTLNFGQPVTFTAFVTSSQGSVSGGTVTFWDGLSPLGTVALSGGSASLTTTLPVGGHSITAAYSGAGYFVPSTSAPVAVVTQPPLTGDVTFSVVTTRAPLPKKGKAKGFSQKLTIANSGAQVLQGPLYVLVRGLKSTVKIKGAAGFVGSKKKRSPFVVVGLNGGSLGPGASVSVTLQFTAKPNRFTPAVFAGTTPR
jgi:type VI protein secretion system component Hcp